MGVNVYWCPLLISIRLPKKSLQYTFCGKPNDEPNNHAAIPSTLSISNNNHAVYTQQQDPQCILSITYA